MPYADPMRQKQAQHASYLKTKAARVERTRQARLERRTIVAQLKLERGCVRCGYKQHAAALDMHHQGDKEKGISEMIRDCASIASIVEECDKCIILCANCHRVEHAL